MKLRSHELAVLTQMLNGVFNKEELSVVLNSPITGYHFTGAGYFLELTNDLFPKDRKVISEPTLLGWADHFEVGFVIIMEHSKLTLECHSWGSENPPATIRETTIEISEVKLNSK